MWTSEEKKKLNNEVKKQTMGCLKGNYSCQDGIKKMQWWHTELMNVC